ncbi:MAG TPA: ScpA family protein [Synergistales bacterium]|jgi:segregation and condensation protein A|nr:ScpA family protein [Synergistales bacterium]HRV70632.1 ScpA family protein [Thermovirgaceae bacterium]
MIFEVELEGFSGPLDLLCNLVESGEVQASRISVSELIRVYYDFLLKNERAGINEMAAFFSLSARLLLGKLKSLLPALPGEEKPEIEDVPEGEDLFDALGRYMPYRRASAHMIELMRARARCFTRNSHEEGPPWFDLGDLYSLSMVWWEIVSEKKERSEGQGRELENIEWDGIPVATPEEGQVEVRMDEIRELVSGKGFVFLSDILVRSSTRPLLVVTILALLEMARLGIIRISQEEMFGDVGIHC